MNIIIIVTLAKKIIKLNNNDKFLLSNKILLNLSEYPKPKWFLYPPLAFGSRST